MNTTRLIHECVAVLWLLVLPVASCLAAEPIKYFDEMHLQRSSCFGSCPFYSLHIYRNGNIDYEGFDFVKIKGTLRSKLSPKQIERLIEAANAVRFFDLQNQYLTKEDGCPTVWTDSPWVTTTIKIGSRVKAVEHYHGCQYDESRPDEPKGIYPTDLTKFEDLIDEITQSKQWVANEF